MNLEDGPHWAEAFRSPNYEYVCAACGEKRSKYVRPSHRRPQCCSVKCSAIARKRRNGRAS